MVEPHEAAAMDILRREAVRNKKIGTFREHCLDVHSAFS